MVSVDAGSAGDVPVHVGKSLGVWVSGRKQHREGT